MLKIGIRTKGKPLLHASFGVQFDKIKSNLFDFFLGLAFEFLPSSTAQFIEFGNCAVFAVEFGNFVKGVDAQIQNVSIAIDQFDGLLGFSLDLNLLQPPKGANPVIDMGNIITNAPLREFFDVYGLLFRLIVL